MGLFEERVFAVGIARTAPKQVSGKGKRAASKSIWMMVKGGAIKFGVGP
jgi:hypothetical protein